MQFSVQNVSKSEQLILFTFALTIWIWILLQRIWSVCFRVYLKEVLKIESTDILQTDSTERKFNDFFAEHHPEM